jgi:hypothetical protein
MSVTIWTRYVTVLHHVFERVAVANESKKNLTHMFIIPMAPYQFQVSVALAVSVLLSLLVFYFGQPQEGKIRLDAESEPEVGDPVLHDPFDVTRPEDVVDGFPVDEAKFWAKVCTMTPKIHSRTYISLR